MSLARLSSCTLPSCNLMLPLQEVVGNFFQLMCFESKASADTDSAGFRPIRLAVGMFPSVGTESNIWNDEWSSPCSVPWTHIWRLQRLMTPWWEIRQMTNDLLGWDEKNVNFTAAQSICPNQCVLTKNTFSPNRRIHKQIYKNIPQKCWSDDFISKRSKVNFIKLQT